MSMITECEFISFVVQKGFMDSSKLVTMGANDSQLSNVASSDNQLLTPSTDFAVPQQGFSPGNSPRQSVSSQPGSPRLHSKSVSPSVVTETVEQDKAVHGYRDHPPAYYEV